MISLPLQGVGAAGAGARDPAQGPAVQAPGPRAPTAEAAPDPSHQAAIQASPLPPLATAAAAQGGLAPLLADLAAALSGGDLPADVQAAAEQVLSFGLDAASELSAGDLQAATARSGLFLEAALAGGVAPEDDFKAMLLDLAQALQPAAGEGKATPARNPPPPPFAGGAVRGQAAVSGAPAAEMTPGALAVRLLAETRAALSRQVLMQAASVGSSAKPPAAAPTRWLFELPVADGQHRAVAQFEISRDGGRGGDAEERPAARARFSLDLAGLGPVHASLVLTGQKVQVALWAEDGETAGDLAAHRDDLRAALQEDGLSAEVVVRDGAPSAPPPPAGRFMDTAA